MGIMTRVTRLCRADMHGVLDQLEDKGLLLKQLLREMEYELGRKEARLKQLALSADQTRREWEAKRQEAEGLQKDLAEAIGGERDDIARILIRRIKPLEMLRDSLQRHIESLEREMGELKTIAQEQRNRYEDLHLKAKHVRFLADVQQPEGILSTLGPFTSHAEPTEEEVELELFRQKKMMKGGMVS